MRSFPKCFSILEGTAVVSTDTNKHSQFQVEWLGTVMQADIRITEQEVIFIMPQPFVLEQGAQLVPQYSEQGTLLAIGLECSS